MEKSRRSSTVAGQRVVGGKAHRCKVRSVCLCVQLFVWWPRSVNGLCVGLAPAVGKRDVDTRGTCTTHTDPRQVTCSTMGGSAVVTPAGLAPLHGSALQSSSRRVRDTISSVLNASIILAVRRTRTLAGCTHHSWRHPFSQQLPLVCLGASPWCTCVCLALVQGLVAVEALFNFLNRNVLGGLVTLMLAFIPACGWYVPVHTAAAVRSCRPIAL